MRRVFLISMAALIFLFAGARSNMSIADQASKFPYTGPTLLEAVHDRSFDPALLPDDDSIQQRWIYAAMVAAFYRGLDDAPTLLLIKRWDGCTMWPAKYRCPYMDARYRSKPIRDALIARMVEAMPPASRGGGPQVCYCGKCILPAASTGDRDVLAPLLPCASEDELKGALSSVAYHNEVAALKLLFQETKLAPSTTLDGGTTALHAAAAGGAMDTARVLIAAGADVNAYQALYLIQTTPLDEAQRGGHVEMKKLLRDAGGLTIKELEERQGTTRTGRATRNN